MVVVWWWFPKADNPALLNMPNTPKAEITACPSISVGELRVN